MNILTQAAAILVTVALSSSSVLNTASKDPGTFELLILHNNDMHARFEQTSQLSGACTTADREAGKCYGGFPRVATVVKEARQAAAEGRGPPVLYLNAGDTYTGTAWFTIYKWKIAAEFVNALKPDAVSLGNHEFDEAVEGAIPFIRNLSSPVLAANLILNKVPDLEKESNLYKSIVITKNGVDIGIIGYLTPDTKFLAPKNDVEYEDEVISIRKEVKKLEEKGVHIIIALGHSGFIKDLEIARDVEGIDLVIGGHSNTFLWNDDNFNEKPEYPQGPYPTIIQQASGRNVPVVQAYAYTKYMGKLLLTFDSDGEIISFDGAPILLNQEVSEDEELLQTIGKYSKDFDRINNEVVGTSIVPLNGDCRLRECNIGNFITDAVQDHTYQHTNSYTDPYIIIIQGGRIRASIDHPEMPIKTTRGDWITVLPYSDPLCIVTMNGTTLLQSLEHSIGGWREVDAPGQFLQISGIEVVYDLAKSPGHRVVSAKIACSTCERNKMVDVKPKDEYKVIMPIFLSEGGDGYGMFENLKREILVYNELDCVINYLKKYSPVNPEVSGRITLLNEDKVKSIKDIIAEANMKTEGRALSSSSSINYSKLCYYITITSYTIIGILINSL